jgi:WXG100 family type VII secretion target
MTSFQVDPGALEVAASRIATTTTQLHDDVAVMTAHLRSLDGVWTGQAAAAFASLYEEWVAASTRVTESLDSIGVALRGIQASYLETEAANVRILGR